MIGLMVLLALGIYLAISVGVVRWTVRWARRTGRGVKCWGFAAAFAMYMLVFWDHIPTLLLYKYYCATKAGFWVYKTPEQWKKENPGVAETMTWKELSPQFDDQDGARGLRVNERFVWKEKSLNTAILPVRLYVESVLDVKTGAIMIKRVSVGAGYSGGMEFLKFWMTMKPYIVNIKEFGYYQDAFKQMGRKVK